MLEVALDLFHERGINAVSVDKILERSGTGKSQFYHYFGSKDGLISEVLNHIEGLVKADGSPLNHKIQGWQDLDNFFQFFIEVTKNFNEPRACPIGFIGTELDKNQNQLKAKVNEIFDFTKKSLKAFFDEAKEKGELKDFVCTEELSDFIQVTIQGGLMTSKIREDVAPLENAIKHVRSHIKTLRA